MIDGVRVVMIDGVREEEIESGRERDGEGGGRGLMTWHAILLSLRKNT
jgi:hypothetical protein